MPFWFDFTSDWLPKLNGWEFMRKVIVKEQSGSDLTDFQVKIELDSSNFSFDKCKSDGGDLRFRLPTGEEVPYWIEKWDNVSQSAIIWIKVPNIPANGETKVYMYYGNYSAANGSNGFNTFMFFGDFEDGDISDWNVNNLNYEINNGILTIYNCDDTGWMYKSSNLGSQFIVEMRCGGDLADNCGQSDLHLMLFIWYQEPSTTYNTDRLEFFCPQVYSTESYLGFNEVKAGSSQTHALATLSGASTVSCRVQVKYNNGQVYMKSIEENGAFSGDGSATCSYYTTETFGYIGLGIDYRKYWIDWIAVRKYASVEPTYEISDEYDI